MRVHQDERRTAYCDLFDTPGDVNLFVINAGQRTCWHRHTRQSDQFRVIRGRVRFRVIDRGGYERDCDFSDPSELLLVEPGSWHGYENIGTEPAYVLMYLDRKFDPTDEERMDESERPWNPAPISQEGGSGADGEPDWGQFR